MRLLNTTNWYKPPKTGETFRVGDDIYICYFAFWKWALIKRRELK